LPTTRALALAALPLEVFVLLFAGHKHAYYYVHEISLYCGAVVAGGATLADRLVAAKLPRWQLLTRHVVLTAVALMAGATLLAAKWNSSRTENRLEWREQEAEVARAAGKAILGTNARVGSRIGAWYSSGAAHWANFSAELLYRPLPANFDVAQYVSHVDAVA